MSNFKVALPKGRLLEKTSQLLRSAEWGLDSYDKETRVYAIPSSTIDNFLGKMFHEKDIAVQVAVGNYDLGICGLDWVNEYMARHPNCEIVKVTNFPYGFGSLHAATSPLSGIKNEMQARYFEGIFRIASEYPSLAEGVAERLRLRRFAVYPLWGSAEAYPPENAELAVLNCDGSRHLADLGLVSLFKLFDYQACLIANKKSLQSKDLSTLLGSVLIAVSNMEEEKRPVQEIIETVNVQAWNILGNELRVALPDGHQMPHVKKILEASGIEIIGYDKAGGRRPVSSTYPHILFKTLRPQDMTIQVAGGSFDLAITGRDWLRAHKLSFPNSPVKEILDLKYGWVRVVSAVHNQVPVGTAEELAAYYRNKGVRICTEYTAVADDYASRMRFGNYRIIPTWGATEAFLPDDADIMVENTETGGTIRINNLKIIETIFESTACLIVNTESLKSPDKKVVIDEIVQRLSLALHKNEN